LRSAVALCSAPATEREFNTFRTALDLTFALRSRLVVSRLKAAVRFDGDVPRPAVPFERP
jgi:hypothetical protein